MNKIVLAVATITALLLQGCKEEVQYTTASPPPGFVKGSVSGPSDLWCQFRKFTYPEWKQQLDIIVTGKVVRVEPVEPGRKIASHACWAQLKVTEVLKGPNVTDLGVRVAYNSRYKVNGEWVRKNLYDISNCPLKLNQEYLLSGYMHPNPTKVPNPTNLPQMLTSKLENDMGRCPPILPLSEAQEAIKQLR